MANDIDIQKIKVADHFIERCIERAPWLVRQRKKKYGGGFEIDLPRLVAALTASVEIERPKTISRLIKYEHRTKYYHYDKTKLKRQLIFVFDGDELVTLYQYQYSWAKM